MTSADPQEGLRREFKAKHRAYRLAAMRALAAGIPSYELALALPWPDWSSFASLRCGARTRADTPCRQKGLYACGRCGLHGGLSTGPRTTVGKATAAQNGFIPKRTP